MGSAARSGPAADAGTPGRSGPLPPAVRVALRHIHDNVDGHLASEEIARQAGVSSRHLSRLMRQHAGTTVAGYVLCARLQVACHLLRRSPLPVKEVAARSGYPDVHHFTRMFARHMGCPPAAYRRGDGPARGPLVRNGQMPGRLV
jgi:transcriptional regulator GlxA family with amidase domain